MEQKDRFIRNLHNIKVIIGNGFDLHCGLKSSYGDYFGYYKAKYDYINKWIKSFAGNLVNKSFFNPTLIDCWEEFEHFEDVNVWDVFFEIISEDTALKSEARWCDIEDEMMRSLTAKQVDKRSSKHGNICWGDVFKLINADGRFENKTFGFLALSAFVLKKHNGKTFVDEHEYYEFLLNELRKFEINFGKYLKRQHDYFDHFINHHNSDYDEKALKTLSLFGSPEQVVSIDSFNFGIFNNEKYDSVLRNINGTLDMPIFGIDSTVFKSDDPRAIFSKTNRRMEMDMLLTDVHVESDFENAVVYGHSLSKNDYSYFFPLLDKLDMTDFTSSKKIIFAFSVFDESRSYQIKFAQRKAIQELFYSYANFKGYQNDCARLLDSLTSQGRILMYEIEPLVFYSDYFWN